MVNAVKSDTGTARVLLREASRHARRLVQDMQASASVRSIRAHRDGDTYAPESPAVDGKASPTRVGRCGAARHLSLVQTAEHDEYALDEYSAKTDDERHAVGCNQQPAALLRGPVAQSVEAAVNQAIAEYRPRFMPAERWEPIADLVRDAVTQCEGKTPHEARVLLGCTSSLVDWCERIAGIPLEIRYVFRHDIVNSYVSHLLNNTDMKRSSVATHRSRLLGMADVLQDGPPVNQRLKGLRAGDTAAPYSHDEQIALRWWATQQPSDLRRINCTLLLAGTLGAGLTNAEMLLLTAEHVLVDDEGVLVSVPGKRPRVVPVLAEWESVIADIADATMRPTQWLFRPARANADGNQVANFLRKCSDMPFSISVQRLRSTWIVTQLAAGTPVQAVLDASGIETIGALGRYMDHIPAPDPTAARRQLTLRARDEGCDAPVTRRTLSQLPPGQVDGPKDGR